MKYLIKRLIALVCLSLFANACINAQTTDPGGCNYYYQSTQSITTGISQSSDDAREDKSDGSVQTAGAFLNSQNGAGTSMYIWGLRFSSVNLPANAIVQSANLVFTTNVVTAGPGAAIIQAENSANPATYSGTGFEVSSRPTTASTVSWAIPTWANNRATWDGSTSSDITVLINEILAAGFTTGNAMNFIVDASLIDRRAIYSFDLIAQNMDIRGIPATLAITYTLPEPTCTGVSGLVFQDNDDNGMFENNATADDYGIRDIVVNIYDDNGLVHTAVTDGHGNWNYPAAVNGVTYRVEHVYPAGYVPARSSTLQSSTETAYATAPECCIDFGLMQKNQFGCAEPQVVAVCNVKCQSDGTTPLLISYAESEKSNSLTTLSTYNDEIHPIEIPVSAIGSSWGLAYNKQKDVLYVGAKLMQSSNVGPGGFGALYCVDNSTFNPNVAGSVNAGNVSVLTTIANPGTASSAPWGTCVNNATTPAQIAEMMQKAARVGLGDVDINDDNSAIYTINLNTRELVEVPVNGCTSPGASNTFAIPTPTSGHDCTGDIIAPFGLKYYEGKVYIGAVCTAENTMAQGNLWAYVFTYTPGSGAIDPNPVLDFPLDYARGNNGGTFPNGTQKSIEWQPWKNVWDAANPIDQTFYVFSNQQLSYPQPILSDIEFYNGNMILGFSDRFGDQMSNGNDPSGVAGMLRGSNAVNTVPMGDVLHAGSNGNGTWTIENNAAISSATTGECQTAGNNGMQGPGNGEFYYADRYSGHQEIAMGSLVQIPGNNDVIATGYDPTSNFMDATGTTRFGSGGAMWLDNKDGSTDYAWEGYIGSTQFFGKGNGFGDIEYMCDCPPLQIGNRIWLDSDEDGVQDPSEAPIAGVIVHLYDAAGNGIATTTTDADGRYYFDDSNVPGGLQEFADYFIGLNAVQFANGDLEVSGTPYGPLTSTNNSPVGQPDTNDNDADYPSNTPSGVTAIDNPNLPYIPVTTNAFGGNDFTFDIGFTPPCPPTQCGNITVILN